MFQITASVFRHYRIHRILLFHIRVIQPGSKDTQAAQLPPVFMRNDVVWIVGSCAFVIEGADEVASDPAACERAIHIIRVLGLWLEHFIDRMLRERVFLSVLVAPEDAFCYGEIIALRMSAVVFRRVLA